MIDEANIALAKRLEDLAKGIREGKVLVKLHSYAPKELDVQERLDHVIKPWDDDLTSEEAEDQKRDQLKYLKWFDSLILFYEDVRRQK